MAKDKGLYRSCMDGLLGHTCFGDLVSDSEDAHPQLTQLIPWSRSYFL